MALRTVVPSRFATKMRELLAFGTDTSILAGLVGVTGAGVEASGLVPGCNQFSEVELDVQVTILTPGPMTLLMFGFSFYKDDGTTPLFANTGGIGDAFAGGSAAVRYTTFVAPLKAIIVSGPRVPNLVEGGAANPYAFTSKGFPASRYARIERFSTGAPAALSFDWQFYGVKRGGDL